MVSAPARHRRAESERRRLSAGRDRRPCPNPQSHRQRAQGPGAAGWLAGTDLADAAAWACPSVAEPTAKAMKGEAFTSSTELWHWCCFIQRSIRESRRRQHGRLRYVNQAIQSSLALA